MPPPFVQTAYFLEAYKGSLPYKGEKGSATELKSQLTSNKVARRVKLLAQLRELTPFLADWTVFDEDYLALLCVLIDQIKDNDNDGRKALRLVYYHITEVVSSLASVRKIKPGALTDLFEAVLRDASSSASCPPHRHLALRTAGLLFGFQEDQNLGLAKLQSVMEDVSSKCKAHAGTNRPTGKLLKKAKDYIEITFLSSAVASSLRRMRACPPGSIVLVAALCCLDNDDTARHAFAALGKYVVQDTEGVSVHFHPKLRATSEEHNGGPMTLSLRDSLAAVHYLRMCAHMAFAPTSQRHTEKMRDDFYRVLHKSIGDPRLRVSLEAVRGLFGFGLQSYQRLAAMEAKQQSVLSKCTQFLTQAIKSSKEANDLPALHGVLRAILLILRILQEGNTRCPAPPPQGMMGHTRPASLGGGGGMMMDFFAPTSPSAAVSLPYQDEMKALGQAVIQAGLTESPHPSLRTTSLRILIWQAPPRAQVAGGAVWPWVRKHMDAAVSTVTDFQLGQLLQDCLDRLDLHVEPLGPVLVTTALGSAEHYFKRAPSDGTAALLLRVWSVCMGRHAPLASALVLASIFRILDHNIMEVRSIMARSEAVWELQGQPSPGLSEARGALARLKRLALGFLGHSITFFPLEHMSAVLLRLQTLAIFADYHTRCSAVGTLCKAAVHVDDLDVKLTIYEFLHSLEVAEFDLNTCPDVKEEVTSLPLVQGAAVDYLDQGGGLCMKDVVAPTMQHLQSVLDKLLEQQKGGGLSASSPMALPLISPQPAISPAGELRPSSTSPVVMVSGTPPVGSTSPVVPVQTAGAGSTTSFLDFF